MLNYWHLSVAVTGLQSTMEKSDLTSIRYDRYCLSDLIPWR